MKKSIALTAAFAFALVVHTAAQYPQPAPASNAPAGNSSSADAKAAKQSGTAAASSTFMMKAAQGGRAEVALGQLAQTKATDAQVKTYGQMLVSDHSKANDELSSLASTKSVTLPADVSASQKSTQDRLEKLSGAAFDRAYMSQMVRDHQADIKEFEQAAKSTDPDVKAFAEKALPTLRHHLDEAQRIVKTLGSSGHPSAAATPR
jgi:putative membrane protein